MKTKVWEVKLDFGGWEEKSSDVRIVKIQSISIKLKIYSK
jgi:hypothetical protein